MNQSVYFFTIPTQKFLASMDHQKSPFQIIGYLQRKIECPTMQIKLLFCFIAWLLCFGGLIELDLTGGSASDVFLHTFLELLLLIACSPEPCKFLFTEDMQRATAFMKTTMRKDV